MEKVKEKAREKNKEKEIKPAEIEFDRGKNMFHSQRNNVV